MKALFRADPTAEADIRPTLLGIVTLLFLLLFFLLSTSTGQRLASLDLRLGSPADLAPLPHTGLVKEVRVELRGGEARVRFEVQTTDIAAAATTVEHREFVVPAREGGSVDLVGLAEALDRVKRIDPSQEHARLDPDDDVTVQTLLHVMDVLRGGSGAAVYPKLVLGGA